MGKFFYFIFTIFAIGIIIFLTYQLFLFRFFEKGALQITSIPPSDVYLNSELIGKTPICKCDAGNMISRGEYVIRLVPNDSRLNYFEEKVVIQKGLLTVVDRVFALGGGSESSIVSLNPLADKNTSQIRIISIPNDAEVLLNNKSLGKTPILLKAVPATEHRLTIRKDGYKEKTTALLTTDGYELTAVMQLAVGIPSYDVLATSSAESSSSENQN
ncbi:MAG: PEGA domain-containing protein [Candidatus Levybacteria bacterium]|nr:PEGA domain-containing protein [Candidatus Levybacteria bacterium]